VLSIDDSNIFNFTPVTKRHGNDVIAHSRFGLRRQEFAPFSR
jgi:hypothetical protein